MPLHELSDISMVSQALYLFFCNSCSVLRSLLCGVIVVSGYLLSDATIGSEGVFCSHCGVLLRVCVRERVCFVYLRQLIVGWGRVVTKGRVGVAAMFKFNHDNFIPMWHILVSLVSV